MTLVIPVTVSLMQGKIEGAVCVEALDGHIMICSHGVEKTIRMVGIAIETYFIQNPAELAKLKGSVEYEAAQFQRLYNMES